jgi:two-component system, OmpR family, response regulator MprA
VTDEATILIADDDEGIRELLRELLDSEGYRVQEATNGAEAIASIAANRPHAVLMDLMMPVVSGVEATAMLKRDPRTASIPVLAMSAGRNIVALQNDIPADDFIAKPFELSTLIAAIAALISRDRD